MEGTAQGHKVHIIFKSAFLLLAIIAGIVYYQNTRASVITVTGEGRASATPEVAKFVLSITETGLSSQEALNNGRVRLALIKNSLAERGVPEQNIKSSSFSLAQTTTGFRAQSVVGVETSNVNSLDSLFVDLLGSSVSLAASPTFTTANPADLESQAIGLAIEDARQKASATADSFGQSLGKMLSFTDVSGQTGGETVVIKTSTDEITGASSDVVEVLKTIQVSFRGN